MHRHVVLSVLALALSACQSPPPPDAAPTSPPVAAEPDAADTCGRQEYAWLLGEDHKQVPAAPEGKVIRVVCSTCAMTMDFNAGRLNVVYDEKSGKVTRLSCG